MDAVPPVVSVDEILKCDHSNESYWAVLFCGAVCYAIQDCFNFGLCGWNPIVWPFKWKPLSRLYCGAVYYAAHSGSKTYESAMKSYVRQFRGWKRNTCASIIHYSFLFSFDLFIIHLTFLWIFLIHYCVQLLFRFCLTTSGAMPVHEI